MNDVATKHVVMKSDGVMFCSHCGATASVPFPISVTSFCSDMDSFLREHRFCAYDLTIKHG